MGYKLLAKTGTPFSSRGYLPSMPSSAKLAIGWRGARDLEVIGTIGLLALSIEAEAFEFLTSSIVLLVHKVRGIGSMQECAPREGQAIGECVISLCETS
jgi:hypothetical protein